MLRCNYVASVVMYPLNLRTGAFGILYRVVPAKTVNTSQLCTLLLHNRAQLARNINGFPCSFSQTLLTFSERDFTNFH
jgi:hypothetical protein